MADKPADKPKDPKAISKDVDEDVQFVAEASMSDEVSDPRAEAMRERMRDIFERDQKVWDETARRREVTAPASAELAAGSTAAERFGPEVARTKDATTRKMIGRAQQQGCILSPAALGAIGFGIAVVIAIVLVVLNGGDDKTATTGPASGGSPAGDDQGADMTSFAGHYVLVNGLDRPYQGDAAFVVTPGSYDSVTPGQGTASLDIDANGQITGGSYRASYEAVKEPIDCTFVFDATTATGSISPSGSGAIGTVTWPGSLSIDGKECTSGYDASILRQIGIVDGNLVMCGSEVDPSLKSCTVPAASYATFTRQGDAS